MPQICDDQAAELRRAEEQLQQMEAALMSRNQQAAGLQAKVAELEAEQESTRQEQRTLGGVCAAKERDQVRKLESLQDEVRARCTDRVAIMGAEAVPDACAHKFYEDEKWLWCCLSAMWNCSAQVYGCTMCPHA